MEQVLFILLATVLVNNVVLVKFLGLCPFMGVSNRFVGAIGIGLATTFVLTLTTAVSWLLDHYLLQPFDIGFMRLISFIVVIAAVVQFTEMLIRRISPLLYQLLGVYLPLITTNCAVLGVALLNVEADHSFLHSLFYGFGSAVGFALVMLLFAGIRERLDLNELPATFAGAPIAFITAGLLSMAFMGFAGMAPGH